MTPAQMASNGLYYDATTDRILSRATMMTEAAVMERAQRLLDAAYDQGKTVGMMTGEVCREALNFAEVMQGERALNDDNPLVAEFLRACDDRLKKQGLNPRDYLHIGREDFRDGTKFNHAIQRRFDIKSFLTEEIAKKFNSKAAEKTAQPKEEMKSETIQHLLNLSLPPSAPARIALASPTSNGIEYRPPADDTPTPGGPAT